MDRISNRFVHLRGKEVTIKYFDNSNDWIYLPPDDLDSFIDMVETAKQSDSRENLKVIELKVCELAETPQGSHGSHKRPRESPSPSPTSSNAAKEPSKTRAFKRPNLSRCLESEFSFTKPDAYETPTQKYFNKLERDKKTAELTVAN